jgi:Taurine catabolism dioxygenase TauD, TfdA family
VSAPVFGLKIGASGPPTRHPHKAEGPRHAAQPYDRGRAGRERARSRDPRYAARPELTCRFRWRPGSIAFWDNRSTWHYAVNDYPGARRLMHRITLQGVPLS